MDTAMTIPIGVKIALGFSPQDNEDDVIRRVFANRIARNLWLGIKWRHLTDQYFTEDCLKIAEAIEAKVPATSEELSVIFRTHGRDMNFKNKFDHAGKQKVLAEKLLPYVRGEADFEYEVAANERP